MNKKTKTCHVIIFIMVYILSSSCNPDPRTKVSKPLVATTGNTRASATSSDAKPTASHPSPATKIPIGTDAATQSSQALYFFVSDISLFGYIFPPDKGPLESLNILHPGGADSGWERVRYSHFADKMAHFILGIQDYTGPSELWISDLSLSSDTKVVNDESQIYRAVNWTPDDLHLIVQMDDPQEPGFIYHLLTERVEVWPYDCDRLALSPKTGEIAVWCISKNDQKSFMVVEWGGDIWQSTLSPQKVFTQTTTWLTNGMDLWGWSMDGQKIAYFDLHGDLVIANNKGTTLKVISGISHEDQAGPYLEYVDKVQWSANGARILVLAKGSAQQPCPPNVLLSDNAPVERNPPCWQVFDSESGKIIWHLSQFMPFSSSEFSYDFSGAAISADGQLLGLSSAHLDSRELVVLMIDSNEMIWGHPTIFADGLHWGNLSPSE